MRKRKYPVCQTCEDEINPQKYEGCERYYSDGEMVFCEAHFIEWAEQLLESDPKFYASLFGFQAVELE